MLGVLLAFAPQLLALSEENCPSKVMLPSRGSWHPFTDQCGGIKTGLTWYNSKGVILMLEFPGGLAKAFAGRVSQPNFSLIQS